MVLLTIWAHMSLQMSHGSLKGWLLLLMGSKVALSLLC